MYAGERVVIPNSMRSEMLQKLHESHLGMEKYHARARSVMYWSAMSNDINKMIAKCSTCLKYRRENQREPLTPHEVPLLPWQKLETDIFEYGGNAYLLIVDYFSKYPEVSLTMKVSQCGDQPFQDSVCETRTAINSGRRQHAV